MPREEATPHPTVAGLGYMPKTAPYRASLQAGIWHKESLKKLLLSGENPWYFEIRGSKRSAELEKPFLAVTRNNQPFHRLDALLRGHWTPQAIDFLRRENIALDSKLPVNSRFITWLKGPCRNFFSKYFAQPIKKLFGIDHLLPVSWG
jgi:hypothetical protein